MGKIVYPCTDCRRKDSLHVPCTKWKDWFRYEWRIIQKGYKREYGKHDERETEQPEA